MPTQLSIDFNPDKYGQYDSCREFIAEDDIPRLCRDPRVLKKTIAADMDYSPSHFSNKIHNVEGHRFTLDDLESYMEKTGSIEPVKYLISKYLARQSPEEIQKQIDELERRKAEIVGFGRSQSS
ncbi:MAG: hypothetical protein N0E44_18815 [Candidatus Thiodiazotropha lotti]|nr:hypothetical protein [Candidatus Thiodiazotropha lotti]MCW4221937.1 hypothetical protein [Candidatus Thiodiazotropha lotti]